MSSGESSIQPKKMSKRGRKPSKVDVKVKLERSRQSARECRARKKLRYQYLEELVASREKAIFSLRGELESCKKWCKELDNGKVSDGLKKWIKQDNIKIETMSKDITKEESETTPMKNETDSNLTTTPTKTYHEVPDMTASNISPQSSQGSLSSNFDWTL